jgi:hypothetical protein
MHANRNVCIHVDPERLLLFSKLHRHPSLHILVSALGVARGASEILSRKALRNCTVIQPGIRSDGFFESPAGGAAARCWWWMAERRRRKINMLNKKRDPPRLLGLPRNKCSSKRGETNMTNERQRPATPPRDDRTLAHANTQYTVLVHRTAGADNIEIASECRG